MLSMRLALRSRWSSFELVRSPRTREMTVDGSVGVVVVVATDECGLEERCGTRTSLDPAQRQDTDGVHRAALAVS